MELETRNLPIPDGIAEIWQRIVDSVAIYLSVPSVMINRFEPPELEILLSNISPGNPLPSGTRMQMDGVYCTDIAVKKQMLHINDAGSEEQWSDSPTAKAGIIAYLGVPLLWPDGTVFGTLCAVDTCKREWEEKAVNLLKTLKDAIESHLTLVMTKKESEIESIELEPALNEVMTLQGFTLLSSSFKKHEI